MKKQRTFVLAALPAVLLGGLLTGCSSDADTVSKNLSTAADQFEVERRIVVINGITDKPLFDIVGWCSINDDGNQLEATCKQGPDDFRKHFLGLSDNVTYVAEQLDAVDADEYRFRIIIKPEQLLPNIDLETSKGK